MYNAEFECGRAMIESEIERRAQETDGRPMLGYRRNPVRAYLSGGWSIEIAGVMAEEWDAEGTWSAWDGQRTIWFTAFSRKNDDAGDIPARTILNEASDPDGEPIEFIAEPVLGRAFFAPYEEDGEQLWNLKARVAAAGAFAVCNFYFHDELDRNWAIATWKSLRYG